MMTSQRGMQMEQVRRERRQQGTSPKARGGFTLIELLIIIVIIGVLIGLIGPALMGAFGSAREASVIGEIKQLESAIAAFKAVYGVEPPSRVVIYEAPSGWTGDPESRATIRRIWPQYDFTTAHHATNFNRDLTGDGEANDEIRLNAGEALTFFLGGMINRNTKAVEGFAKNAARPFLSAALAASREGPFFEFDAKRFVDLDSNFPPDTPTTGVSGYGWREYRDGFPGQTKPYLYFSSREGRGYQTISTPIDGTFLDIYRVFNPTGTGTPNPPGNGTGTSSVYPAHKPQTFQIISPGVDGQYGKGGVFNSEKPSSWLSDASDYDNLTNFHGGRLKR